MNIPDEAVEAAVVAVYGVNDLPDKLREFGPEQRRALEAAAPYIIEANEASK
jgi:hypothetical protein